MVNNHPLLKLEGITKVFPHVVANRNITLELAEGEVLGLLGENGAGKTTLMNVLYGLQRPDAGRILIRGREVEIRSPRDAIRQRIGMVHQHFMLVPTLTIAENVMLGRRNRWRPLRDRRVVEQRIRELSAAHELGMNPRDRVQDLSVGQRQKVEILKLLFKGAEIFILDEPTAVLTPEEAEALFASLRSFTTSGHGVIFISHKLEEMLGNCDRITVLRDGVVVTTIDAKDADKASLARSMVGRDVVFDLSKSQRAPAADVLLRIQGLEFVSNGGGKTLKGLNLDVCSGEILGVAGVDGNGQEELAGIVSGCLSPFSGKVLIGDEPLEPSTPNRFASLGGALIPADRQRDGLAGDLTIGENLMFREFRDPPFARFGILAHRPMERHASRLIKEFDIRAPGPSVQVRRLSGGNQQKVVVAREFSREPRVVVAVQPSRGLDVGATEFVYRRLLALRNGGAAILLISTELSEILMLSDRVGVIYRGTIMGVLNAREATAERIGSMMAGLKARSDTRDRVTR